MAGTNICPRVIFNHRNQWPGIGKTYVTYRSSFICVVVKFSCSTHVITTSSFEVSNNFTFVSFRWVSYAITIPRIDFSFSNIFFFSVSD
ncbi:hypothetical protein N9W30_00950 [bacterium]|nr:hypothetical protein [bacterium]